MSNPEQELRSILDRIKVVANDQNCAICKEDLDLAGKGVEASMIKLGRMNSLAHELESKKLMDIDDRLKERYAPSAAPAAKESAKGLGIDDILLDVADMLDDVKEITNIGSILPAPPALWSAHPGLAPTRKRPPFLPPLPHELLLGMSE